MVTICIVARLELATVKCLDGGVPYLHIGKLFYSIFAAIRVVISIPHTSLPSHVVSLHPLFSFHNL